jgi:DNA-binding HxlR family transcriptional regulator
MAVTWKEERVRRLVALLAGRWVLSVLDALDDGPLRRRKLRLRIDGVVSEKVLTETLTRLADDGFVTRTLTPGVPPRVDYALTELAASLAPILDALDTWVAAHFPDGFSVNVHESVDGVNHQVPHAR